MKYINALIVAMLFNSPLFAVQVFDGGDPGYHPSGGYTAGVNLSTSTLAADFELSAPAVVTDVTFWTLESGNEFDGGVKWYFINNNINVPAGLAFAKGTGIVRNRTHIGVGYRYDVSLDQPVALEDDTPYWFGLKLNDSTFAAGIYWVPPVGWLDPPLHSAYFRQTGRRSPTLAEPFDWNPLGTYHDFAFKLYDNSVVPEPATCLLAMLALPPLIRRRG